MEKNLLLVGGAGYIGSVLAKYFLKNKKISKIYIIDKLLYKYQNFDDKLSKNKKIIFLKKDFSDTNIQNEILPKVSFVVMLAGLVGDPITKKYPKISRIVNNNRIKKFIINSNQYNNIERFIFISTCSNYGVIKNKIANEKSKLNPKSSYAKAKINIEKFLLRSPKIKNVTTILRFATAFGLSPRMRFDLTLNQFCKEALLNKYIEIYDSMTWRPYCHVLDFSRIIQKVIFSDKSLVDKEIFNAGSDFNNSRKIDIAKKVKKKLKALKIFKVKGTNDPRDYRVSFKKLHKILKIKPKYSLDDGINEIVQFLKKNNKILKDKGNFVIKKNFTIH